MSNEHQRDTTIRTPHSEAGAQDARNAAIEERARDNVEASRAGTAHEHASTPNEVSEKTVAEIAAEAEARARR